MISEGNRFARTPFAVADAAGTLHVVWSESVGEPLNELGLDTIYYTRRVGDEWTTPIDILSSLDAGSLFVSRLRIDAEDGLHLVGVRQGNIVYAHAMAAEAASAKAWSVQSIPELAYIVDMAIAPDGVIHLAYAVERRGVYHSRSEDQGLTWSSPSAIWQAPNEGHTSGSVRLEVDPGGVLHAAWGMNTAELRWNPAGIAYARSVDGGTTWTETLRVLEGDNLPSIGFDQNEGVHVVWNNPAGSALGRGHAWSQDGGITWAQQERIFEGYRGQTWWPVMERDSSGALVLVFAGNPPDGGTPQTFYSVWRGDHWSEPRVISGNMLGGEGPTLAVVLGNRLDVAWFSFNPDEYGIWYTSAQTAAPGISPRSLLAAAALSSETVTEQAALVSMPTPTTAPAPTGVTVTPIVLQSSPGRTLPSWLSLVIAAGSAVMLVLVVLMWRFTARSRT